METALSTISVLPSNKEQVKQFVNNLKNEILANTKDPLKILVHLKFIEKTIAEILKDDEIDRHFVREFTLYGKEKVVEVNGAKLSEQETGVKYDYEASGDSVWIDLNKQIAELSEKKKQREEFLKVLPDEGTVDPETGLFITRPPRSSKTKVVVRL